MIAKLLPILVKDVLDVLTIKWSQLLEPLVSQCLPHGIPYLIQTHFALNIVWHPMELIGTCSNAFNALKDIFQLEMPMV